MSLLLLFGGDPDAVGPPTLTAGDVAVLVLTAGAVASLSLTAGAVASPSLTPAGSQAAHPGHPMCVPGAHLFPGDDDLELTLTAGSVGSLSLTGV
jgi:hypothetical protein